MATKQILVSDELHRRIKATAAMSDKTIRDWVEEVIADALAGRPSTAVLLIDAKEVYNASSD